jgi:hypothetical protein
METEYAIILILFAHFVSDFVFQTDKQAINKSTSNLWLTYHVLAYTTGIFLTISILSKSIEIGLLYALLNGCIHWGQDYVTSRINSKLWRENKRHWFFVGIGADQFIHATILILTYSFIKPPDS